jgi:hypothetical protein
MRKSGKLDEGHEATAGLKIIFVQKTNWVRILNGDLESSQP